MKKVKLAILFLFALANFTKAVADDYIPLVKEGAVWYYDQRYFAFSLNAPSMKSWFEGDTIIEGEVYKRQFMEMADYYPEPYVIRHFFKAWQEHDKKVYAWDNYLKRKVLYYDFNLKKGDTIPDINGDVTDACEMVIDEDTIEVNWIKRRRLTIKYEYVENEQPSGYNIYWVEGVGSSRDLWKPRGDNGLGGYSYFEYLENDTCLFTQENFYLPRNGAGTASGISSCYSENMGKTHSVDCFDLQGRRLKGEPKRGIYIKDGKKVCR